MCTQRVPAKDPVSLPVSSKSIHSSRSLDLGAAVAVGVVGELLVALASEPTPDALWPNANEVHRSMRLGGRRGRRLAPAGGESTVCREVFQPLGSPTGLTSITPSTMSIPYSCIGAGRSQRT